MAEYPVPNADGIKCRRAPVTLAATAYRLPDLAVPDDMELKIKAGPLNAGTIWIAEDANSAVNPDLIWPLLRNEAFTYRVKNADLIFYSGTVAGDSIYLSAEQRK